MCTIRKLFLTMVAIFENNSTYRKLQQCFPCSAKRREPISRYCKCSRCISCIYQCTVVQWKPTKLLYKRGKYSFLLHKAYLNIRGFLLYLFVYQWATAHRLKYLSYMYSLFMTFELNIHFICGWVWFHGLLHTMQFSGILLSVVSLRCRHF